MTEELEIELRFDIVRKLQKFREDDEGHINSYIEEVDRDVYIDETEITRLDPVKFKDFILTLINQKV
jgi:hypothetical protein